MEENERGDVLGAVIEVSPDVPIAIDLREQTKVSNGEEEGGRNVEGRRWSANEIELQPSARGEQPPQDYTYARMERAREGYLLLCDGAAELPQGRLVVARHQESIGAQTYEIGTRPARCDDTQGGASRAERRDTRSAKGSADVRVTILHRRTNFADFGASPREVHYLFEAITMHRIPHLYCPPRPIAHRTQQIARRCCPLTSTPLRHPPRTFRA